MHRLCLVALVLAFPTEAQKLVHKFSGDSAGDWLGASVANAGDIDKDGLPDIIVGATQGHFKGAGYARVYSSRTGSELPSSPQPA